MRFCGRCGAELKDEDNFCQSCGSARVQSSEPIVQGNSSDYNLKAISIAIAIIVIFASGGIKLAAQAHSASYTVVIYSTHIIYDVDVDVTCNGDTIYSGTLPSGNYITHGESIRFPIWDDAKRITVSAHSSGGGLGDMGDSTTLDLKHGTSRIIELYV